MENDLSEQEKLGLEAWSFEAVPAMHLLCPMLDRVMIHTSVVSHLDASRKEDLTLAMTKRVLAGVTCEIEARVLAHGTSRLQASPIEARVLLGTAMVVGV